jgi:hypothetical protein
MGSASCKMGYAGSFSRNKLLRCGCKLTPKSSALFKNAWIYINLRPICASIGMLWGDLYRYITKRIINNPNSFISSNLCENPKRLQDRVCRFSKPVGFRQAPRASRSSVKNVHCELFLHWRGRTFDNIQNSSLRSRAATLEFWLWDG